MKLLYKYSRINLFATVAISLLASIAFYFLLRYVLERQLDDDLEIERHEIEMHVKRTGTLPDVIQLKDQLIHFEKGSARGEPAFSTIRLAYGTETRLTDYRRLVFYFQTAGVTYEASVLKSFNATDSITHSIIAISLGAVLLMLCVNFAVNRLVLQKLWQPFYNSLFKLKSYRPGRANVPQFDTTDIEEFERLNDSLAEVVHHAENEYKMLKEFTENASHEMQTPLAVIRAKLDVLIQDEKLSEKQAEIVQGTYDAVQRLVRLNQSMLLLNKIENNQFVETAQLDLRTLVENKISFFRELTENKGLTIRANLCRATIQMNPSLADVLLNNLFSNAVRHTTGGGHITIELTAAKLIIANGKAAQPLDDNKIFTRFYKGGVEQDEHGLGMAIVQQICIVSGIRIGYSHSDEEHRFGIFFK